MALYDRPAPGIEPLEPRRMLAGNVLVSVLDGDLMIRGDRQPNAILITQALDGTYTVTGAVDDDDQLPTTVNGAPSGTFAGVDDDLRVRMGRGDDRVQADGIHVPDDYGSNDINGDDTTLIDGAVIGDRFKLLAFNVNPRHNVRVDLNDTEVATVMSIDTGAGNDEVNLVGSNFGGDNVGANLNDGDDVLRWVDSESDTLFGLRGGVGADRVRIVDSTTRQLHLVMGEGDDTLRILRGQFELLTAFLSAGDDLARVRGTTVTGRDDLFTQFIGGEGSADTFEDEGDNTMSRLSVKSFENV